MKLELIVIGQKDYNVLLDANRFFNRYANTCITKQQEGFDIEVDGVEIGSYGFRRMPDGVPYTYGTGVAEPRFSGCIRN